MYARLEERDWLLINEDKRPSVITSGMDGRSSEVDRSETQGEREFQIVILAKSGIGLSMVNRDPAEELLYAFMSNVVLDYQSSPTQKVLDGSIQNIQVSVRSRLVITFICQ